MARTPSGNTTKMVSFRMDERMFHDHLRDRPNRTAFIVEGIRMKAHAEAITRELNEIFMLIDSILEEGEMDEDSRHILHTCKNILERMGKTYGI